MRQEQPQALLAEVVPHQWLQPRLARAHNHREPGRGLEAQGALRQAAVADRIVLTKTDLPQALAAAIMERLAAVNPGAPVLQVVNGAIAPDALFDAGIYDVKNSR